MWKLVKAASFCSAYYKPVGKKYENHDHRLTAEI